MTDVYADAVVRLQDAIVRAVAQAETYLTPEEIARELRYSATEVEEGAGCWLITED